MDFLKRISGIIAILALVIAGVAIFRGKTTVIQELGATGTRFPSGLSTDSTSPSDGQVRTTSLTVTGASTLTGTTSPAQLQFPVRGTISTTATGTVRTIYTNTTGPKMCDSHSAFLLVQDASGSFAPSLVFSIGTSTSAIASTNLIASSTVATSTTTVLPADAVASTWRLPSNGVITAIFGDITNTTASSTYFSLWTAEFGIVCQELSI